ncbi:hypothetical protein E8E13_005454 [Curvularia kusanoi]|uniref:Uncharacterized protein n=1 Tax=Curvularia kusanoi TaxID=90978 RepID=A0A9P4T9T6_CURKU|nr:hypothetical protein E8E13_005454 [Curvularia kusanoi]
MDSHRVHKGKRPATDDAVVAEPSETKKRQKTQQASSEETHQQFQPSALLRLPQELQDIIYGYVYGGRNLTLHFAGIKGFAIAENITQNNVYTKKYNVDLPGLAGTCKQLRETSKLYFELNKIYCPWSGQPLRALDAFAQALTEDQRQSVRYVSFLGQRNINEFLSSITSYWESYYYFSSSNRSPYQRTRQISTFPLSCMMSLRQVVIYVRVEQEGTAMLIPPVRAMLGLSSEVTIEIKSQKLCEWKHTVVS